MRLSLYSFIQSSDHFEHGEALEQVEVNESVNCIFAINSGATYARIHWSNALKHT
jgi:hypothetical protein